MSSGTDEDRTTAVSAGTACYPAARCIVADPPWTPALHKNTVGRSDPKNGYRAGPQKYYGTLTLHEICALQPVTAEKCHLWLWVLSQHVDWGYAVARAWGFEPQQMLTWAKPSLGTGQFQCNTEHVLMCRKGGPVGNAFGQTCGTWFEWPRGGHSEKPSAFFGLVERVSPGPYVEMFARSRRIGWEAWGNQVERQSLLSLDDPDDDPDDWFYTDNEAG